MRTWERLIRVCRVRHAHVTIQYVPGHVELEKQEEADVLAKEAAQSCRQEEAPVSLGLVKAILRAQLKEELRGNIPKEHLWARSMDGKNPKHDGLTRRQQRILSQLRAGCYDVDARIDDMDANGVLGSLCFPSVPGFVGDSAAWAAA